MVGLNLLRGIAQGHRVDLADGGSLQSADERHGRVLVAFSPHAVALSLPGSAGRPDLGSSSPRNVWNSHVAALQHIHGRVRVRLLGPPDIVAEVTPAAAAELAIRPGQHIVASVKATEIEVYPG
jgi:molybdate transport system ATP-binding protein